MTFEFIDHTADAAVDLVAPDAAGLFEAATEALWVLYCGESASVDRAQATRSPVDLAAPDGEGLLVGLLGELIFLFDTRDLLVAELRVNRLCLGGGAQVGGSIEGARLEGTLIGYPAAALDGGVETEVKAATYHDLELRQTAANEWRARVVFDL